MVGYFKQKVWTFSNTFEIYNEKDKIDDLNDIRTNLKTGF